MPRTRSSTPAPDAPDTAAQPGEVTRAAPSPVDGQEQRSRGFLEAVESIRAAGRDEAPEGPEVPALAALEEDFAGVEPATGAYRELLVRAREAPATCRARVLPRISAAEARERLGKERGPRLVHQAVATGCFRISVRYYGERQQALTAVVDLADAAPCPELLPALRGLPGAESEALPARATPKARLARALERLPERAEERAVELAESVHHEVAEQQAARRAMMEGYFEGLEEEYKKEERRLAYHLYYFDRAERLAARRRADLSERQALLEEEARYYQVETTIEPVRLAILSLPLYVSGKQRVCGLTGELL